MPFQSAFQQLFTQDAIIAAAVFLVVVMAMIGAFLLSRQRRKRGQDPSRQDTADRLETGYVLALAGIAGFLIYSSFAANAREFPDPKGPLRVQVTGYQWCWRFRYQGQPVTVDAQCNGDRCPRWCCPPAARSSSTSRPSTWCTRSGCPACGSR